MRSVVLSVAVAALVALAGCGGGGGGDDSLSADEAAAQFEQGVADATDGTAQNVQCEDASQENYWDCTGKIAGFQTKFQLHLEGDTIDIVKPADRVPPAG
jgi:hypothetical protein